MNFDRLTYICLDDHVRPLLHVLDMFEHETMEIREHEKKCSGDIILCQLYYSFMLYSIIFCIKICIDGFKH